MGLWGGVPIPLKNDAGKGPKLVKIALRPRSYPPVLSFEVAIQFSYDLAPIWQSFGNRLEWPIWYKMYQNDSNSEQKPFKMGPNWMQF